MEWINCKNRLPEVDEFTLIWVGIKVPLIGCYKGNSKWLGSDCDFWIASEEVTHWAKLPEPPKQ